MSVYTTIQRPELEEFLAGYELGELVEFHGISAGIENTNYFVTTSGGEYVLTLFEKLIAREIPYFLELTAFLAEHGVPAAHPARNRRGRYLATLKGKPAAIVARLRGASVERPNLAQLEALGATLARMHREGRAFAESRYRVNDRGPRWWRHTAKKVLPRLEREEAELIEAEIRFQAGHQFPDLPRGVIHADLFRDNALFDGDRLSGVIDFYYACNSIFLYDLAVVANDWCVRPGGALDFERVHALLTAYHAERPLKHAEKGAWPVMLRAAALRFWLSRLHDALFPRPGEMTHTKDPDAFRVILLDRIRQRERILESWV